MKDTEKNTESSAAKSAKMPAGKSASVLGIYGGVILGAIGMMIGGLIDNKTLCELSLVLGLCAAPLLGWVIGKIQQKNAAKHPVQTDADDTQMK